MLSLFVFGIEATLTTLEASNVIAMRLRMIAKGDAAGRRESELMISEKLDAFAKAGRDMAAGVSNAAIRQNFRTLIQANEARLGAIR